MWSSDGIGVIVIWLITLACFFTGLGLIIGVVCSSTNPSESMCMQKSETELICGKYLTNCIEYDGQIACGELVEDVRGK